MSDARRPPPRSGTVVLVVDGPVARADVPALCERLDVLLRGGGAVRVVCDVGALGDPDTATLDVLARLQLTAVRRGYRMRLRNTGGGLRALLALTGMAEALPVEPVGQAEHREERSGVEERVHPGDHPV